MRDLARPRELAESKLVQDLARLFVAPLVDLGPLVPRQGFERPLGQVGVDPECLIGGDQRVAAEQCREPGDPGVDRRRPVEVRLHHPKVQHCAIQVLLKLRIGGAEARASLAPDGVIVLEVGVCPLEGLLLADARQDAHLDRLSRLRVESHLELRTLTADPLGVRFEPDLELAVDAVKPLVPEDDTVVADIGVEDLARLLPLETAHDEQVEEVRPEREREPDAPARRAEVLHLDRLVHAVLEPAVP
jgi:hypothetical protein